MIALVYTLLGLGYAAQLAFIIAIERRRHRDSIADALAIFSFFFAIYIAVPGLGIHLILAIDPATRTGVYFFDRVYDHLDAEVSAAVLAMAWLFIISLYFANVKRSVQGCVRVFELSCRPGLGFLFVTGLLALTLIFFNSLGADFAERYAGLILFRASDDSIERNWFSANIFSLSITGAWLSVCLAYSTLGRKRATLSLFFFSAAVLFALAMGSRRGPLFIVLILYFAVMHYRGKFYFSPLVLGVPAAFLIVAFGKDMLASVAFSEGDVTIFGHYKNFASLALRAFSDIGVSQVESYAVLLFADVGPRFGIDHLLSLARLMPDGMLGLNIDWPERIVRTTTALFDGPHEADIPPGLLGQAWIDFNFAGALIWGLFLGLQARILDRLGARLYPSRCRSAVMVICAFMFALPINSGSYDFTLTVNMVVLLLLVVLLFRMKRTDQVQWNAVAPARISLKKIDVEAGEGARFT